MAIRDVVEVGGGRVTYTPSQIRAFQRLLIDARRRRNLTQMEAAREIGVSQTLVSTLERGPHKGMRVDELFRLLAFYGITPNQVAILLGYATDDEQASAISDPHLRSLVQSLEHLPDDVTDAIVRALDLMVRGAHG